MRVRITRGMLVGMMLFGVALAYGILHDQFPMWRDVRIDAPFGGTLTTKSGLRIPEGRWFSDKEGSLSVVDHGQLLYKGEQVLVEDEKGKGEAVVLSSKRHNGGAVRFWLGR